MKKAILLTLVIVLLTFSACGKDDILKIGFDYTFELLPEVMSAACSDHSEFKIDNITLDFYFGGHVSGGNQSSSSSLVGLVLYFCNAKYLYDIADYVEDYQKIDGLYFVRAISEDEFNTDKYSVSQTLSSGKKFSHKERLTVPQEVIESNGGDFCIIFASVIYVNNEDVYSIYYFDYLAIHYTRTDSKTIRLSKSLEY